MFTCQNCRNRSAFRLSIDHVLPVGVDEEPALSMTLQCAACDSTAVDGDPLDALERYLDR